MIAPPVGRAGRPSRVDVKAVAAPVAVLVGVNGVGVRLSAERRDILLELGQLLDRSLHFAQTPCTLAAISQAPSRGSSPERRGFRNDAATRSVARG